MDTEVKKCFFCGTPLVGENKSKEHVIPNSIGGKLTTYGFICKACNNKFGEECDADLANQLHTITLLLNIHRERKEVHPGVFTSVNGEDYRLYASGKIEKCICIPKETILDNGKKRVEIHAPNRQQMAQHIKGYIRKFKKNTDNDKDKANIEHVFKNIDIDKLPYKEEYIPPLEIKIEVGGTGFAKSIVKTCLALCSMSQIRDECTLAKNFLNTGDESKVVWAHCDWNLRCKISEDDFSHCIHVQSSKEYGYVAAYVELFSIFRFIVILSDEYKGENFYKTYTVDPISGKERTVEIDIPFENISNISSDLTDVIRNNIYNNVLRLIRYYYKKGIAEEYMRVLKNAHEFAFQKICVPSGELLTRDNLPQFIECIMEYMTPFILHFCALDESPSELMLRENTHA